MKNLKLMILLFLILLIGISVSQFKTKVENVKKKYIVQEKIKPNNLKEISDEQINDHWKLYMGYVKESNKLNQDLKNLEEKGEKNSLLYADRRRRYGFEYNGMLLHQYYFSNLKSDQKLSDESRIKKELIKQFGSFENWAQDFEKTGSTRSVGWTILYLDPENGNLTNHFIQEHGNGIIVGFIPILVMDVWEHAYMVDHKSGGRSDYIKAFMQNINWPIVEKRFDKKSF